VRKSTPAHDAATPATKALVAAGIPFTTHSYDHDPAAGAYGLEAAAALGLDPALVFKTLLVDSGGSLAVAIIPVNQHLDLKAVATELGAKKVTMAEVALAERTTGYIRGGISPIGQKRALPTLLDESASGRERIYVSGGRRGFDVGLAPSDLVRITRARMARIARPDRP